MEESSYSEIIDADESYELQRDLDCDLADDMICQTTDAISNLMYFRSSDERMVKYIIKELLSSHNMKISVKDFNGNQMIEVRREVKDEAN